MSLKGPRINHLSYVDDLILFFSAERKSTKLILNVLNENQKASGQEINKDKSFFLTQNFKNRRMDRRLRKWTRMKQAQFPFTYLGCPIYTGMKKICHFSDLASRVLAKTGGWQGKILSFGGRETIIKHVLQSHTFHLMAVMAPL